MTEGLPTRFSSEMIFLLPGVNVEMFCCETLLVVNYMLFNGIIIVLFCLQSHTRMKMFNACSLYIVAAWPCCETLRMYTPFSPKFCQNWPKYSLVVRTRWQISSSHLNMKIAGRFLKSPTDLEVRTTIYIQQN